MNFFRKREEGALMLEGVFIVSLTMIVLSWIIPVGFLHYPKFLTTVYANDAARKLANVYDMPMSDMITGYSTVETLAARTMFLNPGTSWLWLFDSVDYNATRASNYIKAMITKRSIGEKITDVKSLVFVKNDGIMRRHVEVYVRCTYETPFGGFLEALGMNPEISCFAVGRAEVSNFHDYISTMNAIVAYSKTSKWNDIKILKTINGVYKLVYNFTMKRA